MLLNSNVEQQLSRMTIKRSWPIVTVAARLKADFHSYQTTDRLIVSQPENLAFGLNLASAEALQLHGLGSL